jgi:hypothetical protein
MFAQWRDVAFTTADEVEDEDEVEQHRPTTPPKPSELQGRAGIMDDDEAIPF